MGDKILNSTQRAAMREILIELKKHGKRDDPKITVLKEEGTLVTISVEFSDEQIERLKKRKQRGLKMPYER